MKSIPVEPSPALTLDGRLLSSETLLTAAGAHVLVLSTSIGELGVTLHSSYLGHPGAETVASHLALTAEAHSYVRTHEHETMPVAYARRLCLYDHLQELRMVLDEDGRAGLRSDVVEGALALVES